MSSRYSAVEELNQLPDEVMQGIFRLFDIKHLVPYSVVCKRWNFLINDVHLWKKMAFNFHLANARYCDKPTQLQRSARIINAILKAPLLHTFELYGYRYLRDVFDAVSSILADNCPRLEALVVAGCSDIEDKTWHKVASASWSLKRLCLYSRITQENLEMVLNSHNGLRVLGIRCPQFTLDALKQLTDLTCLFLKADCESVYIVQLLESIDLQIVQISLDNPTDTVLAALSKCTRLKILALKVLSRCRTNEAVVTYIKSMSNLTHFQLCRYYYLDMHLLIELFSPLCNLEYLSWQVSVDDTVVRCITETCGKNLRYLEIASEALWIIAECCPEMEVIALNSDDVIVTEMTLLEGIQFFTDDVVVTEPLKNMTSKMPKLRQISVPSNELIERMSVIFPNASCSLQSDWFPDISVEEWRW